MSRLACRVIAYVPVSSPGSEGHKWTAYTLVYVHLYIPLECQVLYFNLSKCHQVFWVETPQNKNMAPMFKSLSSKVVFIK